VKDALATVKTLEPEDRNQVILEAKQALTDWYQAQIDAAVDEARGLYNYPAAEKIAGSALELYPDSARMQDIKERIENRKNQLLNELNTRFNQHLAEGRLLPSEQDNMVDVLRILAQVAPGHPLLTDPRLPAAYAQQASVLFEAGDLEQSSRMLVAGLERYPEDINLVNLRDKVQAEQLRVERELRIAQLQEQLGAALASLTTLAAIDTVRGEVIELKELLPEAPLLKKIQGRARERLEEKINAMIAQRAWDPAFTLLQDYSELVDGGDYLQGKQRQIASAQQQYQDKLDAVYAALLDAATKRRLDAGQKGSAPRYLAELDKLGAEPSLLDQGRAAIGQAYLQMAREARAGSQWEDARTLVQQGLKQQPGVALVESLQAENLEIARAEQAQQETLALAEREARERQRQARIQEFRQAFENSLAGADYDSGAATQSLKNLDQLAAVSPADPLVTEGRIQVAERLAGRVEALSGAGKWEDALALAREAVKVIPGSELLSTTLLDIERGRAQQIALQREQSIEQNKQALTGRLAKPVFDDQWETALRGDIKTLTELLPADDAWLLQQRSMIATLYFEQEKKLLADAEARFQEENKEKLALARIEGNKQTLLTQAKANDIRNARKTLEALRAELPQDDPFLSEKAPNAIGNAYLRLADSAARKRKYQDALKLVRAGSALVPAMQELKQAEERYQRESRIDDVRKQLAAAKVLNVSDVRKALGKIKADKETDYAKVEQEFGTVLYQRVRTLAIQDYQAAETLLSSSKELFPQHAKLAALKIAPPAVKPKPAPVARPEPATPKPTTTAPRVRTASGGVSCRPTLAGYGRRARGTCYDMLMDDLKGPLLVVVPSGDGVDRSFAISKYEISVSDYNNYCKVSGACSAVSKASADLPVTGISYKQAQAYASWVSKQTGFTYRIPTAQEWSYAANAQGKQPGKDFNCRVLLGSQVIKGQALGSVKMGKPNGWGLKNYVGNAQEWVTTSSGLAARGGAYPDSLSKCSISLSKTHSGQADEVTGFRLVRELKMGG
jgi:hypothetical protein